MDRKPYPTDVSDEEWAFIAPHLTLMREYPLREVFNGLRYVVRGGISWRMIPNDLPSLGDNVSANAALAASGGL